MIVVNVTEIITLYLYIMYDHMTILNVRFLVHLDATFSKDLCPTNFISVESVQRDGPQHPFSEHGVCSGWHGVG